MERKAACLSEQFEFSIELKPNKSTPFVVPDGYDALIDFSEIDISRLVEPNEETSISVKFQTSYVDESPYDEEKMTSVTKELIRFVKDNDAQSQTIKKPIDFMCCSGMNAAFCCNGSASAKIHGVYLPLEEYDSESEGGTSSKNCSGDGNGEASG